MSHKRARSPNAHFTTDPSLGLVLNSSPSETVVTSSGANKALPASSTDHATSTANLADQTTKQPGTILFKSNPIHDRKSIFLAIFSPSPSEHLSNPKSLQRHSDFTTADHKILAWRKPSSQQSLQLRGGKPVTAPIAQASRICTTWSDDDGEKYAGKRLEKVLNELNVEGVVVVARWWGGVMLGPARFIHIEECAREAVRAFLRGGQGNEPTSKRLKMDQDRGSGVSVLDDAKERSRLIGILKERDESVRVLRGLLSEKNGEIEKLEAKTRSIKATQKQTDQKANVEDGLPGEASDGTKPDTNEKSSTAEETNSFSSADGRGSAKASSSTIETPESTSTTPASQPKPEPTYHPFPLETLKKLEKARDTTLSWVLKQIDAAEVKIKDCERALLKLEASDLTNGDVTTNMTDP